MICACEARCIFAMAVSLIKPILVEKVSIKVTECVPMSKYTQVLDKSVNFKPKNRGLSSRDK